jgi:hypothetical protein
MNLLQPAGASGLSTLVFSGYTLDEVRGLLLGPETSRYVDMLVADATCRHAARLGLSASATLNPGKVDAARAAALFRTRPFAPTVFGPSSSVK